VSVYSLTNFLLILIHLPGLIPELSVLLVGSSTNILSSASESTSHHLILLSINSAVVGFVINEVPSLVITCSTETTLLSGKITSKNGIASAELIIFLKILDCPLLTISLLTKV